MSKIPLLRDLTVSEAADRLDVSPATVRRRIRDGDFEAEKVGNTWLVSKDDVEEELEEYEADDDFEDEDVEGVDEGDDYADGFEAEDGGDSEDSDGGDDAEDSGDDDDYDGED